jgi:hypothetical protein
MSFLILILGVVIVFIALNFIGLGLYISVAGTMIAGFIINKKL